MDSASHLQICQVKKMNVQAIEQKDCVKNAQKQQDVFAYIYSLLTCVGCLACLQSFLNYCAQVANCFYIQF